MPSLREDPHGFLDTAEASKMTEHQEHLGLTDDGWQTDASRRLEKIYGRRLLKWAGPLAYSHKNAIDYLEQCPALMVYAWGAVPLRDPHHRRDVVRRFGEAVGQGMKLRALVERFGGVPVLRRLKGKVLFASYWEAVASLRDFPAIELGNMIPTETGDQHRWLQCVRAVFVRANRYAHGINEELFQWGVRAITAALAEPFIDPQYLQSSLDQIADLVFRGGAAVDPNWTIKSALRAAEVWHEQLYARARAQSYSDYYGIPLDVKFDYAPLPDRIGSLEFEFVALRSGRELAEEGAAMKHCVASYLESVSRGSSRIYSIRRDGERVATLELAPRNYSFHSSPEGLRAGSFSISIGDGPVIIGRAEDVKVHKTYGIEQLKGPRNASVSVDVRAIAEAFKRYVNSLTGGYRDPIDFENLSIKSLIYSPTRPPSYSRAGLLNEE
jgi:hypothetical protein